MTSLSRIIKSVNAFEDGSTVTLYDDVTVPTPKPSLDDACLDVSQEQEDQKPDLQLSQIEIVSETILTRAKVDADRLIAQTMDMLSKQREAMLCEVTEQADKIRKQAYEEGRNAGMSEGLHTFDEELSQISAVVSELQNKHAQRLAKLEDCIAQVALEIAEKILNKHIIQDESEMEKLVQAAIAADKGKSSVTVELSQEMPQLISSLEEKLKSHKGTNSKTVELRAVDLPAGACRVESEDGIIDASIWAQIENLKAQLEDIG